VFPTRTVFRIEYDAAIDAALVPQDNLSLKPSGNVPMVHFKNGSDLYWLL
jgi:hypothetical protein